MNVVKRARSSQYRLPFRVADFTNWSDDSIINLLCAVICTDLDHNHPKAPQWACDMLDEHIMVSGCSAQLVDVWLERRSMITSVTTIGKTNLREMRAARGLTQWKLRVLADVSVATISAIEMNGLCPTPMVRAKLAGALGVSEVEIWPQLGDNLP